MAHVVIRLPPSVEAQDRSQAGLSEIFGILSGSDVSFLQVRRFSTVRTIPPVLHTLSFITSPIQLEQLSA
jgi:hypothetical protein